MQRSNLITILALFFVAFLHGCSDPVVPGGRLIIKNDILDKEYNSFVIDSIVSTSGLKPFSRTLRPGEQVELPFKKIREFRIVRQYIDHAKIYQVGCPDDFNTEVVTKLIDIHSNRIGGGCELRRRGRRSSSGIVSWEE